MSKITKEKLEEMYHSMNGKDLCKKLGVTYPTLLKLIDEAGIERKGSGNRAVKVRKIKVVE